MFRRESAFNLDDYDSGDSSLEETKNNTNSNNNDSTQLSITERKEWR